MCGTDFVNLTESGEILQTIKMSNDIEEIKQNFFKSQSVSRPNNDDTKKCRRTSGWALPLFQE